jgi:putative FmdB family regulatory protein
VPTYQYACTDCGEQLEVVQKFTDNALTVCPACDGRLRKVFSAVGVVFKGSGFYRTDSRAAANGSTNGSSSKASPNGSADSSASSSGDSSSTSDSSSTTAAPKKESTAAA